MISDGNLGCDPGGVGGAITFSNNNVNTNTKINWSGKYAMLNFDNETI